MSVVDRPKLDFFSMKLDVSLGFLDLYEAFLLLVYVYACRNNNKKWVVLLVGFCTDRILHKVLKRPAGFS